MLVVDNAHKYITRDFLDLDAERACSSALAAFGAGSSAPRASDFIPLDEFAALAEREAAGLDLTELELRQAVRNNKKKTKQKNGFFEIECYTFCKKNANSRSIAAPSANVFVRLASSEVRS